MPAKVTLTITQGKLAGQSFPFDQYATCIVGRAPDCHPALPDDEAHRNVSRHHCLLEISPPNIRVRDFGSMNGTYLNGERIGKREAGQTPEEAAKVSFPQRDLKDADEIKVGETVFRVAVYAPAACGECGAEIPPEKKAAARDGVGFRCENCRKKAEEKRQREQREQKVKRDLPKPAARVCVVCGKDVSREAGAGLQGNAICASCKQDPFKMVKFLMERARGGDQGLVAIQGYTVLKELGRGGMGAVYLARHEKTGAQVALKVMLPQAAADKKMERRFMREVDVTKALKHPNIVNLMDLGCSNGTFFFAMEFCDGGSVDRLMAQRGGKLPLDEAAKIIFQALEGLAYAHAATVVITQEDGKGKKENGVVHRDLKPANIFLAGSRTGLAAKVADFGLARAFRAAGLSGLTITGTTAGSPWFMPRQQVTNFRYAQPEVDVWAMAACLYNLLTGQHPRDFPRGKDPWLVVLKDSPVPIRNRLPSVPKKLAEVIDQALIDQPAIVFKKAVDFKRALEGALS
jgi:hypothetical protein